MSGEFASSSYTAGQLNAMVKKLQGLAGDDAVERLLQDKLFVLKSLPRHYTQDEVTHLHVDSFGKTTEEWLAMHKNGWWITNGAMEMIAHLFPVMTNRVRTFLGIIYPDTLEWSTWTDLSVHLNEKASRLGMVKPSADVALLLRDKFFFSEVGLRQQTAYRNLL